MATKREVFKMSGKRYPAELRGIEIIN